MGSNLSRLLAEEQKNGSKEVVVSHHTLKEIPSQIAVLKNTCERLDFSNNLLNNVPYELAQLTRLKVLILSRNEFRFIPSVITEIKTLEELDLSRNKITKFPRTVADLPSLRVLDLTRNRIVQVPKVIANMSQLKILRITDNPLVSPPKGVLRRPKGMTEEDWLIKLKDWLNYEGMKQQADPSFVDRIPSSSSNDSTLDHRNSNVRPASRLSTELAQRAESIEELRKAHHKQRERLARQLDHDIRQLREKHDKELRREQDRHQQLRKSSEKNWKSEMTDEPPFVSLPLVGCEELFRCFYQKPSHSTSPMVQSWLSSSIHLVTVFYQLLSLVKFLVYVYADRDDIAPELIEVYEPIAWQVTDVNSILLELIEHEEKHESASQALNLTLIKDSQSIFLLIIHGYRLVLQTIYWSELSTNLHIDIERQVASTIMNMNVLLLNAKRSLRDAIAAVSSELQNGSLSISSSQSSAPSVAPSFSSLAARRYSQSVFGHDEEHAPPLKTRRSFSTMPSAQLPLMMNGSGLHANGHVPADYLTNVPVGSDAYRLAAASSSRSYRLHEMMNPMKHDRPVAVHPAQLQRERWQLRVQAHQHQLQQKFSSPPSPYLTPREDRRSLTYSPSVLSESRRGSQQQQQQQVFPPRTSPSRSPVRNDSKKNTMNLLMQDMCEKTQSVLGILSSSMEEVLSNEAAATAATANCMPVRIILQEVDAKGAIQRATKCRLQKTEDVNIWVGVLHEVIQAFNKMRWNDAVEALMPLKRHLKLLVAHVKQLEMMLVE